MKLWPFDDPVLRFRRGKSWCLGGDENGWNHWQLCKLNVQVWGKRLALMFSAKYDLKFAELLQELALIGRLFLFTYFLGSKLRIN